MEGQWGDSVGKSICCAGLTTWGQPWTHWKMEGEKQLNYVVLWPPHAHCRTYISTLTSYRYTCDINAFKESNASILLLCRLVLCWFAQIETGAHCVAEMLQPPASTPECWCVQPLSASALLCLLKGVAGNQMCPLLKASMHSSGKKKGCAFLYSSQV